MSVYREWRERVAKAWHDPTDTSGEVRDEPHDDSEYASSRGYAGRPVGVVWGTVNPDGSVTGRGFRDDESYSEDTAVHPAMSMVAYRAEADTWVHMATGQTTTRQREIDAERAERAERAEADVSTRTTTGQSSSLPWLDGKDTSKMSFNEVSELAGRAGDLRDEMQRQGDPPERIAEVDRDYQRLVEAQREAGQRMAERRAARTDMPPAEGGAVNDVTKGAVDGVSKITPTGLAAAAASGVTGKEIKSPVAAAATGGGTSSGGSGAMASVEEVQAAIAAAMQKADSAGGAVQQAQTDLEEAQAQLMQATEGSGNSEFSEANALLAQAVASITEVQQSVQAAKQAAETGAGQL